MGYQEFPGRGGGKNIVRVTDHSLRLCKPNCTARIPLERHLFFFGCVPFFFFGLTDALRGTVTFTLDDQATEGFAEGVDGLCATADRAMGKLLQPSLRGDCF